MYIYVYHRLSVYYIYTRNFRRKNLFVSTNVLQKYQTGYKNKSFFCRFYICYGIYNLERFLALKQYKFWCLTDNWDVGALNGIMFIKSACCLPMLILKSTFILSAIYILPLLACGYFALHENLNFNC